VSVRSRAAVGTPFLWTGAWLTRLPEVMLVNQTRNRKHREPERPAQKSESTESNAIPGRHGADIETARRLALPILWGLKHKGSAEPSRDEWQALGTTLNQGDPLADDVATWMREIGARTAWQRFEKGIAEGVESVRDNAALYRFLSHAATDPAWLDRRALDRGIAASGRAGATGMLALRDLGLWAGYRASAINQTLIRTGALEGSAQRRVAQTTTWWMACNETGGMNVGEDGYHMTLRVRLVHALVRASLLRSPDWDRAWLGLPINQLDMQATYLAFSVVYLIGQRMLGVPVRKQEAEDIMHLWRYIAWLMGVDEQLLVSGEDEGRVALYCNLLSQPGPDETSKKLGRALMDEPLDRRYRSFAWLRGQWNKQVHLSIIRFFLDADGMESLDLPKGVLPWFPMLFGPPRFVFGILVRMTPATETWWTRRGRQAQHAMFETLHGERTTPKSPLDQLRLRLGRRANPVS
jgi:hypothetical protein